MMMGYDKAVDMWSVGVITYILYVVRVNCTARHGAARLLLTWVMDVVQVVWVPAVPRQTARPAVRQDQESAVQVP